MKIKITNTKNKKLAEVTVTFIMNGKHIDYISDKDGIIDIDDATDNEQIEYYIDKTDIKQFDFVNDSSMTLAVNHPKQDMLFIISNLNAEPAVETTVVYKYLGKELKKVSTESGEIKLLDIPVNTEIISYQLGHDGKQINEQKHICKHNVNQYFISLETTIVMKSIKFKLTNPKGEVVSNKKISFKVNGNEFDAESNDNGYIFLNDVEPESKVEYRQVGTNGDLFWQECKLENNAEEYSIIYKDVSVKQNVPTKHLPKSNMKFTIVDSNNKPIVNAVVSLEIGVHTRNKYTNQFGEITSDDLNEGDKLKVSVDVKGKKISQEYFCQGENEQHKIMLKSNNNKYYIIGALLFVIILFTLLYIGKKSYDNIASKPQEDKKKDTLIISNYNFRVNSAHNQKPINNSKIKLIYSDTTLNGVTDKYGVLQFKPIENKLPLKFEISKLGFNKFSENYKLDSVFNIQLNADTSIFINPKVNTCNFTSKYDGVKTNYQTFELKKDKGRFSIWFNLFRNPYKIKVYKGNIDDISDSNIIYHSQKSIKGIFQCPYINYESKGGIVTICIVSDTEKSNWVYKVYCPRNKIVKRNSNDIIPQANN